MSVCPTSALPVTAIVAVAASAAAAASVAAAAVGTPLAVVEAAAATIFNNTERHEPCSELFRAVVFVAASNCTSIEYSN